MKMHDPRCSLDWCKIVGHQSKTGSQMQSGIYWQTVALHAASHTARGVDANAEHVAMHNVHLKPDAETPPPYAWISP